MVLRDEILEFACAMEDKMAVHDAERGDNWKGMGYDFLLNRLEHEEVEYWISLGNPDFRFGDPDELLDIANFCMMLYHRLNNGGDKQ